MGQLEIGRDVQLHRRVVIGGLEAQPARVDLHRRLLEMSADDCAAPVRTARMPMQWISTQVASARTSRNDWCVNRELSATADTGIEKRLPSWSIKSMLAVNDTGFCDSNDTTTGSRSFAKPMRLPCEKIHSGVEQKRSAPPMYGAARPILSRHDHKTRAPGHTHGHYA